jgi:hypothetical protein
MLDAHAGAGAAATVGLRRYFHHVPFGCAELDHGRVCSLQEKPTLDITELRKSEKAMLGSYGWVDKEKGVVRIPIEEAISLVAARGLPVRGAETPAGLPSPAPKAVGKQK